VQDWNDVVVDLPQPAQRRLIDEGRQRIMNQGLAGTSESSFDAAASQTSETTPPDAKQSLAARRVMEKLKVDEATHLDFLVETLEDVSASEIIAVLFELEILGLVRQQPGRKFVKVW
jgi:DNA processing protein